MDSLRHVHIPQLYFKVMWIFAVLLYILIPLNSGAISLVYNGIVLITFGCFFLLIFRCRWMPGTILRSNEMVCFVLLVLTIGASFLINSGEIRFNSQIIGVLGFLEMPLAIILMDSVEYNKRNQRFVLYTNILIAFVFSALSISKYAYSGTLNSLYLGYSNPNATAIYLLLNQAILIMYLPTIRKFYFRAFVLGLCVYEEYLIYLTDSRTCMIVSFVIIIYYVFVRRWKIPMWTVVIAVLVPLAFLLIYSSLFASGRYTDLSIMGKELYSGREVYFLRQLNDLSGKLLFGDVRQHYFTNMHNGPLAIIASCGVMGYACWFLFYIWTISKYRKTANNTLQNVALVAILGVFIHSSSEAALMVGGAHYSIVVATFYWILKGDPYADAETQYE